MTYPPQQPDPGGWEQQPAGSSPGSADQEPAGTPQHQPAWYGNQHTGWGQQPPGQPGQFQPPQFPQERFQSGQGQWEQAQPGQFHAGQPHPGQQPFPPQPGQQGPGAPPPPDWGGGEFGQHNWTREPDGFAAVEPPEKKSKLPWLLGIVAVLVLVGGIGGGVYFFFGGPGEARTVAQDVVGKVNSSDFAGLGTHLCQRNRAELESELQLLEPGEFDVELGGVSESGEQASAQLTGSYEMDGFTQQIDQTMGLVIEDGSWKVCDLDQ